VAVERLLYNDESGSFLLADEALLRGLRDTFEEPPDDDEYIAEFEELERHGWLEPTPLTIAIALGDVHDQESLMAWQARQAESPVSLSEAVLRLTAALESGAIRQPLPAPVADAAPKVESPYFTREEAAIYLRTTADAIYGRVERGQLRRCPGVKEYLFTQQMLDDHAMGRVEKPKVKSRRRS
jgi:hypothetical protein